jgi:hypothetical protein
MDAGTLVRQPPAKNLMRSVPGKPGNAIYLPLAVFG